MVCYGPLTEIHRGVDLGIGDVKITRHSPVRSPTVFYDKVAAARDGCVVHVADQKDGVSAGIASRSVLINAAGIREKVVVDVEGSYERPVGIEGVLDVTD